jgi:hypothetical protein
MALLGEVFKGWGPGILIGVGAAVAAPAILPAAGAVVRPLAKALIVGCISAANAATEIFSEAKEQVSDLVAEARAEHQQSTKAEAGSSRTASRPMHS